MSSNYMSRFFPFITFISLFLEGYWIDWWWFNQLNEIVFLESSLATFINKCEGTLCGSMVKTCLPKLGHLVWFLIGKLISHMFPRQWRLQEKPSCHKEKIPQTARKILHAVTKTPTQPKINKYIDIYSGKYNLVLTQEANTKFKEIQNGQLE